MKNHNISSSTADINQIYVWFGRTDPHPDCDDNIYQLVWKSSFPHH